MNLKAKTQELKNTLNKYVRAMFKHESIDISPLIEVINNINSPRDIINLVKKGVDKPEIFIGYIMGKVLNVTQQEIDQLKTTHDLKCPNCSKKDSELLH